MQIGSYTFVPIDIVFTLIILVMTIKAIFRGFVSEFMGIAAVGFGILFGIVFSSSLGLFISQRFGIVNWSQIIAFLAIFIATYFIIKMLEKGISTIIDKINLDKLDRSLGLFFGIIEGLVVVLLIVFIIQIQPVFDTTKIETESIYFQNIQKFLPQGKTLLDNKINV